MRNHLTLERVLWRMCWIFVAGVLLAFILK